MGGLLFHQTVNSGRRLEDEVCNVLQPYTSHLYKNVRLATNLTEKGSTEIDVIAVLGSYVLVFEVKNVSSMVGGLDSDFWKMRGSTSGEEYTALNVFTQNRLHCSVLKNTIRRSRFASGINLGLPAIVPIVIVPDSCNIEESVRSAGILSITELERQIPMMSFSQTLPIGVELDCLLTNYLVK